MKTRTKTKRTRGGLLERGDWCAGDDPGRHGGDGGTLLVTDLYIRPGGVVHVYPAIEEHFTAMRGRVGFAWTVARRSRNRGNANETQAGPPVPTLLG